MDYGTGREAPRLLLAGGERHEALDLALGLWPERSERPVVDFAAGGRRATELLRVVTYDIVLADIAALNDLGVSTEAAVSKLVKLSAGALVIALADGASISAAVAAMRAGAHDYLSRPVAIDALGIRIAELARRHGKIRSESQDGDLVGYIGVAAPRSVASDHRRFEAQPVAGAQGMPVLPMWRQEQRIIEEAISAFSGNVALAAAALEISPSTIYRKRQSWADMSGAA